MSSAASSSKTTFKGRASSVGAPTRSEDSFSSSSLPPAFHRMTLDLRHRSPIPEFLLPSGPDEETPEERQRRAFDPYHLDVSAERQTRIRDAPGLVQVLSEVPPFYRGTLEGFIGEINVTSDKHRSYEKAAAKLALDFAGDVFPSNYNGIKVPHLQVAKGSEDLLNLHWVGESNRIVSEAKSKLLACQIDLVKAQRDRTAAFLQIPALVSRAQEILGERYAKRNEEGTFRWKKPPGDDSTPEVVLDAEYKPYRNQLHSLSQDLPTIFTKVFDLKREALEKAVASFKGKAKDKASIDVIKPSKMR
ncbi:hypothetical protein BJ322DRAFT_1018350 [Thelephora terrestris]|uniref:Uncharacterized protein n=1 Tax=Thelephora terrestris TaxID=56493 RepID=A0A9P6HLD1_9AGAM|nr:hypothetical protein BJ322DRAFT_1018350 [Thelephora terrestris]